MTVERKSQPTSTEMDWSDFRARMPIAKKWAYFDHAAVAPLSGPAQTAIAAWTAEAASEGDAAWPKWKLRLDDVRKRAASLLNANSDEIAFVPSTTAGINLVAEGFPWRDGDNIVTFANEFPSNLYPWMHVADRGVETRRVDVTGGSPDLSKLADACDARTRIIAVSWVSYCTGWRLDLDAVSDIAERVGARFFLDAIQGLGIFPLDLRSTGVDYLAADGHKWMLGPEGAGIFFVKEEHMDELRPLGVGWNSVVQRYDFTDIGLNIRKDASRYEGGSPNMIGYHGLGASLDLLCEFGAGPVRSRVGERVTDVTNLACQRLLDVGANVITPRRAGHESGIVVFDVPGQDPAELRIRCQQAGVIVSCRGGGLRISPHVYNNEEDIERLIEVIGSQESKP